ncbi:MAG: DUF5060 domain-containing protein [Gemmatimonadales bacterium]|nr:DUF5060 domain-containing protein [Gemmatimonadales bacterium]NIN09993.1 DUF5060 domain-containing protein [Gemmatimonadales bacterium]NIR01339.1 DUF5060 domain-containing protein [Gemmatimonadales bacterium]NIS65251.1 DUF5060 domain-containing protein [Gemmatimonadales bacterium]
MCVLTLACVPPHAGVVSGELKKWHKVTITFDGPTASEEGTPNPFLDYRLNATFTNGEKSYTVPGYFAADGDAANSSATAGSTWRVHFAPDEVGTWRYAVSFRQGPGIAVSDADSAGESAGHMDGARGSFTVEPSDKEGRDFRGRGRLQYVGERYLRFAETAAYFLKCGADAPENLLAYRDFDGDFKEDGESDHLIKDWAPHLDDWNEGDPSWQDGKGRGLIGAINYLASTGMNAFSFLTMNIAGDDRNVFPYTTYDARYRFDVSRLDQWEMVFEHADRLGLYLHFKTQESENQTLLDDGDVGVQRRLYYRELIARFGHHLALNWNLGEENGTWGDDPAQTTDQRRAMAQYFFDHDPYRHHVVIHNGQPFDDLLGDASRITGLSVQTDQPDFSRVHGSVLHWLRRAGDSGRPLVVAVDEPGDHLHSLLPDEEDPEHDNARKNALWGALLAGGAGVEWYFGYEHPHSDLTAQDWRSRDRMWDQCRIALEFFEDNAIPFWEMRNEDRLSSATGSYVFAKPGDVYVVYLKHGEETTLDLEDDHTSFELRWFNPRTGEFVADRVDVEGGTRTELVPPTDTGGDWLAYLRSSSEA